MAWPHYSAFLSYYQLGNFAIVVYEITAPIIVDGFSVRRDDEKDEKRQSSGITDRHCRITLRKASCSAAEPPGQSELIVLGAVKF